MRKQSEKTPTMQDMLKYWYTKLTVEEIADRLGITVNKVHVLRRRYQLPKRSSLNKTGKINYEPTPEEIAATTAVIRANWTPTQEISRGGVKNTTEPWTPPCYVYDGRSCSFSGE